MQTNTYPREIWFDIETLVAVAQPKSIALLGDFPASFLDTYLEQQSLLNQQSDVLKLKDESAHEFNQQMEMAIVAGIFDRADKTASAKLISQLRDVLCRQFCVALTMASQADQGWTLNELLALGLRRVNRYPVDGTEIALFKFNINEYKSTPDWLNADNWANPDMWGKYWW